MKKIVAVWMAWMPIIGVMACRSHVKVSMDQPLTVLVMDSSQALLNNARVVLRKDTFVTSFDGRVVLKPEQIAGAKQLKISCDGYKSVKVSGERLGVSGEPLIVRLTPTKKPRDHGDEVLVTGYGKSMRTLGAVAKTARAEGEMLYATMDVAAEEAPRILPAYDGAANNAVSAGKLTAGEVNDFTKWNLWDSYQSSAVSYQQTWHLSPLRRYTVQVMNKDGYPVVNYPVQIKDEQGNTLFQSLTDNTGKAELWDGLTGERMNGSVDERIVVDEPCDAPEGVDVLFVFDATGSMGDELRYLQAEMNDVIARAKEATGGLSIRTGAVVYRDHGDEYLTRISRLTEEIRTTQTFIDRQEANGGGDYPEAVPEALMAAINSAGWDENARARIAFLILDAPCHEDSASVALLHEQVRNAAAMGVRIVPVVCSGIDKSAEYLLRNIALITNGTSFFLTDDSGIGHTHLKPTTDTLKVEHLNDMLVRTIVEFSTMPECNGERLEVSGEGEFLPNPFDEQDLASDPTIPHGEGVHYLLDVSGKLLGIFEGDIATVDQLLMTNHQLPIGIYFIKTYYNGTWFTRKVLVR